MILGVLYWAIWRVILPRVFGYVLAPRKQQLEDGTFVTLVSSFFYGWLGFKILGVVFAPGALVGNYRMYASYTTPNPARSSQQKESS
jgi:hypothetical protein